MGDLIRGSGPVWIIPEPRCPEHGQMREDFARDTWTCAGWDGEGCGYTVRNEDRKPVLIGQTAGPVTIRWAPGG